MKSVSAIHFNDKRDDNNAYTAYDNNDLFLTPHNINEIKTSVNHNADCLSTLNKQVVKGITLVVTCNDALDTNTNSIQESLQVPITKLNLQTYNSILNEQQINTQVKTLNNLSNNIIIQSDDDNLKVITDILNNKIKLKLNLNITDGNPIGTIIAFAGINPPTGYLLCDGSEYNKNTHPEYTKLWNCIENKFGGKGKGKFLVPDLRGKFLEGCPINNTIGTYIDAGLPNITGEFNTNNEISAYYSGAFYNATKSGTAHTGKLNTAINYNYNFNAANGGSKIYGNSTTVQPPAVCINYYIKYQ